MEMKIIILLFLSVISTINSSCDITSAVFDNVLDGMPAAFGDYDSDELTDVFVIRKDGKTLEILLSNEHEPLLRSTNLTCKFENRITSIVPGDYDGNVFMDILVTTLDNDNILTNVYVLWNDDGTLNCSGTSKPLIKMIGQPLTIDYNQDMIIDLFGTDADNHRTFWIFNNGQNSPEPIQMNTTISTSIRSPHSNAFLDLNGDFYPDIMITTNEHVEIWNGSNKGFNYFKKIKWPYDIIDSINGHIGQSLNLDVELRGELDLILPICFDNDCKNSTIAIYNNGWHNMNINFIDDHNDTWGFVPSNSDNDKLYNDAITLRGGDFNMDGYPDLLATLKSSKTQIIRSFLLINSPCIKNCKYIKRTFVIEDWNTFNTFKNDTIMAVFYDFYQNGILDVILVQHDKIHNKYQVGAFKNDLDYDASFIKVMVLTSLTNPDYPLSYGSLGKKKRTYGTNLPGPSISYDTTTQEGNHRKAIAAQLPQSAHFSLNLPYTTFGLGRTPNFVDKLLIGVAGYSREWRQIIPNSQMVVIPKPIDYPPGWKAQLFVTPSKLIYMSAAALAGTCVLISFIILYLWWKERREDKFERLQEAHRFHFDAM
ncbi:hypothetical protein HCN44_000244 [Aphidius gifuensis]|uniref:T-cell immunomodulatory protein TIP C2 domain-containing protein n=1 Tax=Aphidius gifuensis TaxID=684658 RepID=A0A835CPB4_APHGI|nr:T-cell immunomodulatory protein [Aphidius gifuensis]KAF7990439.1 hypothetical protein HCN44_000244 [Aphidius gifuensis]